MHDRTYTKELLISNAENGYRDLLAKIDINSYRRIPWEEKSLSSKGYVPFFLISFHDPITHQPIAPDPRSFVKRVADAVEKCGWRAMAGG
jgi:glutamine synthetase